MTRAADDGRGEQWIALAAQAQDRARRANARAAQSRYPVAALAFEREAELNISLAQRWASFCTPAPAAAVPVTPDAP